jgi:hypothetical protein
MLDDNDGALFEAAYSAMTGSVVPYIASCYARIYPGYKGLIDVRKAVAAANTAVESGPGSGTHRKQTDRLGRTASSSTQLVPAS